MSSTLDEGEKLRLSEIYGLTERQRELLVETLTHAETALDDWVHTHAPELCDQEAVKATRARIDEVGTLYYIGMVLVQVRTARKLLAG